MNDLNKGDVEITLAGEKRVLRRSLDAYNRIGNMGSPDETQRKVLGGDLGTIGAVIRWGLGLKDHEAKKLPEQLFNTALSDLRIPVADYVWKLFHNGMSLEEVIEAQKDADGDEGKAGAAP